MLRINNCTESQRDAIMQRIFETGVSVNVHFQPLPLLSAYKNMGYAIEDFPVAFSNYANEISLPVYYDLSDEDINRIIDAVVESVNAELC
jgi:dTDP-4-amino-4,6-dideoxygalactose transaminase